MVGEGDCQVSGVAADCLDMTESKSISNIVVSSESIRVGSGHSGESIS